MNTSVDLSVIVATRDRAGPLKRTLNSLRHQRLGSLTWQLVVVDNGSSDSTSEVLTRAAEDLPLTVILEPEPGKNRALNSALAHLRGDLFVFADDDIVAEPDWIIKLVQATRRWPSVNIFGGTIRPSFPDGTPLWMSDKKFPHGRWAFSAYSPRSDEGPTWETPLGPNLAIRASRMRGVTFDETIGPQSSSFAMGSEVELLMRLQRQGEPFVYVPDAQVTHVLPPEHVEPDNLKRRAFRCGRGNARLFSRTASRYPIFGIPVHLWSTLAATAGRRLASFASTGGRRVLAELDFQQALGHVCEVDRMRRAEEIEGRTSLFPSPRSLLSALRKVVQRTLSFLRTVLVPYSTVQVFTDTLEDDEAAETDDLSDIDVYHGIDSLLVVLRSLSSFPHIDDAQTEQRLRLGDSIAVARRGETVIGYAWAAYRNLTLAEVGGMIKTLEDEVIGYDIFVSAHARGTGVATRLDRSQMRFACKRGFKSQLTWVESRNRSSIDAIRSMGKRKLGAIHVIRLRWGSFLVRWSNEPVIKSWLVSS